MICDDPDPCGQGAVELGLEPPPPDLDRLARRLGHYDEFRQSLISRIEQSSLPGSSEPIGHRWDLEGDREATVLVDLWAYVAEGVAAYAELAAGESYLATATDWLSLARLADQVGYRPAQRVAAEGWVRFETDRLASPRIPANTRVQAPGTPEREPQTFEVIADTDLDAEWAELTATWLPRPERPTGRTIRFLGDPGFRAGDEILLVEEKPPEVEVVATGWLAFWAWLIELLDPTGSIDPTVTPLAVVIVVGHHTELGTTVVEFDRDLGDLLESSTTVPHAAYRIIDRAGSARRLSSVLRIPESGDATNVGLPTDYLDEAPMTTTSIVLDRELPDLSTNSLVAVVDWAEPGGVNRGDVLTVANHVPIEWEVAPGTPVAASSLHFSETVGVLDTSSQRRDLYVLDGRVSMTNYVFPTSPTETAGAGLQLRVWPAPLSPVPSAGRLAVETELDGVSGWELIEVTAAAETEADPGDGSRPGLILDVGAAAPVGGLHLARASGNVVRVRHGSTTTAVLGSGDGVTPHRVVAVPDAPVAAETGADGSPVASLQVRLDGRLFEEHPSLFDTGPVAGYETRVGPDGELDIRFGDGVDGVIPPSGVGNIGATYRIGGGTIGEVGSGEIDTLLGSIRGVRSVLGAGPTSGGADQPTEAALRRQAPTRARAMDRIVALSDAADLALAFPGVSHAVAWQGEAPPGVVCGPGPMVAILRRGAGGVRNAVAAELDSLRSFLDARRDTEVALCVVSGEVVPVDLAVTVAADAAIDPELIASSLLAALTDVNGVLAADNRQFGQPVDRSDVVEVIHSVDGVVGVESMVLSTATLDAASADLGRLPAERYQLLVTGPPSIQVVSA